MRRAAVMAVLAAAATLVANDKPKGDLDFTYAYPPQARAIPKLRAWLNADAAHRRAEMQGEAASDHRDAIKDKRPFNPYQGDYGWKVVTDTSRFLSLSLETFEFTGGAHGNTGFGALVWDKTTGTRHTPLSFFTSKAALAGAVKAEFCRQLDAERRQKRDGEVSSGTGLAEFDHCIDPAAQTVILGSSTKARFDRIGFLISPYAAGPYVEGTYEVTVPVTLAVLAAVSPPWRPYFAVKAPSRGTP